MKLPSRTNVGYGYPTPTAGDRGAAQQGVVDCLQAAGFQTGSSPAITTNTTLAAANAGVVLVDASAGSITLTLMASGASADNVEYVFVRVDTNAANTVTIQRSGSDTIEGATSLTLPVLERLTLRMPNGATDWRKIAATLNTAYPAQGRLTLTASTPVTTTDVTAATTVRYTPYNGDQIALPLATAGWEIVAFAELVNTLTDNTKNPAATASSSVYDLFVWNDAGTLRLSRGPAWTNDTTRSAGSAIALRNGIGINSVAITNGPAAGRGRWVGTFRTTSGNQAEDSAANRFVWNAERSARVDRHLSRIDVTGSWVYSTNTWRQANGSSLNQVNLVCGAVEDIAEAEALVLAVNTLSAGPSAGIGVNSTSANSAQIRRGTASSSGAGLAQASWRGYTALGVNSLVWLERPANTGTTTFYGSTVGGDDGQSGLLAKVRA